MGGAGCCDNKAFGEPCSECAFDERLGAVQEQPCPGCAGVSCPLEEEGAGNAVAALDFGLLSAESQHGVDSPWRGPAAAETYRRSEAGSPTVDFLVERMSALGSTGELHVLDAPGGVESGFSNGADSLSDDGSGNSGFADDVPLPPPIVTDGGIELQKKLLQLLADLFGGDEDPGQPDTEGSGFCCCCLEWAAFVTGRGRMLAKNAMVNFTVTARTSWRKHGSYKKCELKWYEYPTKDIKVDWTVKKTGEQKSTTVPAGQWTDLADVAGDHPIFTEQHGVDGEQPNITTIFEGNKTPPCSPRRTGQIEDRPNITKASGRMSIYGIIRLISGCPPTALVQLTAKDGPKSPPKEDSPACKNYDIHWFFTADVAAGSATWYPTFPGGPGGAGKTNAPDYKPPKPPKGASPFPK